MCDLMRAAVGGAEQRLRQREHRVLQGGDARGDAGGGGLDGLGHRLFRACRLASSLPSIERTRSYWSSSRSSSRSSRAVSLLSSAPRVAARPSRVAARPSTVAAIPVARLVHGLKPQPDLLQRAGDRPLLDEVIVYRAREQLPHSVGGGMLPVVRGRGPLAGAQQQVVVARLVHLAPSCAPAVGGVRSL